MTRNFDTNLLIGVGLVCIVATGNLEAIAQMPPPGPPPPLPKEYQPVEPPARPPIPSTASISPAKRKLIIEYLDCSNQFPQPDKSMFTSDGIMPTSAQVEQLMNIVIKPEDNITPAQRKDLLETVMQKVPAITERTVTLLEKSLKADTSQREVDIYLVDKYFSESDLVEMVAFFKSPVGQKLKDMQVPMMNEKVKWVTPTVIDHGSNVLNQMMQEHQLFEKMPASAPKSK